MFKNIIIIISLLSIYISSQVDNNDETQLFESIIKAINHLKIPYSTYEDTIDQKSYIKLLKYLMLNELGALNMLSGTLEDSFLLKLSKEITQNLPSEIKIKDLPKYLNPRMIEPMINKILNDFDFNSLIKKFSDELGFTDKINEEMKERERKDQEREKINQERIRRNKEKEEQMKKNIKQDKLNKGINDEL